MKAHELLSDPNKWTKDVLARRHDGSPVPPTSPAACSFCIVGALYHCYPSEQAMKIWIKLDEEFYDKNDEKGIGDWNDDPSRTHEEVVELLKKLDI